MIFFIKVFFILNLFDLLLSNPIIRNNFCNFLDSETVYLELMNIFAYYSDTLTNDTCPLAKSEFTSEIEEFFSIQNEVNPSNVNYLKCKVCSKRFKSKGLLTLHQKLFHMNNTEDRICLGDFCRSMNCDRYKSFFDIVDVKDTSVRKKHFSKGAISKKEDCDINLVPFYKNNCMKLAQNCFGKDTQSYFTFYNAICKKITCDFNKDYSQLYLPQETGFLDVLRLIFMYIAGIISFVYILIIFLAKY